MENHDKKIAKYGHTTLRSVLNGKELEVLVNHCTRKIWSSDAAQITDSGLGPERNTRSVYGDSVTDELLETLRPQFESVCNKALIPTYSFYRFYPKSTGLGKHTDRPACEYTVSVCLNADYSLSLIHI